MAIEIKVTGNVNSAIGVISNMRREFRQITGNTLRQTGRQLRNEGATRIKLLKYAPTLPVTKIKESIDVDYGGSNAKIGWQDQTVTVSFGGGAIPIMYFRPSEHASNIHPRWGQLWETRITMWGRRFTTHAFHVRGNARRGKGFRGTNEREDLQRGGFGGNPGPFNQNSKLFYRKYRHDNGNSLPIIRFKTFSVGGLMASEAVNLLPSLTLWTEKQIELNFMDQYIRRENAIFRGF